MIAHIRCFIFCMLIAISIPFLRGDFDDIDLSEIETAETKAELALQALGNG